MIDLNQQTNHQINALPNPLVALFQKDRKMSEKIFQVFQKRPPEKRLILPPKVEKVLQDHQRSWILEAVYRYEGRCINADDMGKSNNAICATFIKTRSVLSS